jgi:plasmid stabilization system protein ParE
LAQIIYTERALENVERLVEFLLETEPQAAMETADLIAEVVEVLENHPLVGRPPEHGFRELVISRGRTGYIALYSFEHPFDTVLVHGVRHQREAGFTSE